MLGWCRATTNTVGGTVAFTLRLFLKRLRSLEGRNRPANPTCRGVAKRRYTGRHGTGTDSRGSEDVLAESGGRPAGEQKQINYYSLLRWHKRLGVDGDAQPEHFVEVPTTVSGRSLRSEGDMARTTPIEIVIGTVVVRVPAGVELGHLQVVLTALEQRPC